MNNIIKTIEEGEKEFDNTFGGLFKTEIKSYILSREIKLLEAVIKSIGTFNPTCGYECEEEKGFQKGITAEQKLIKKLLSDTITQLKNK